MIDLDLLVFNFLSFAFLTGEGRHDEPEEDHNKGKRKQFYLFFQLGYLGGRLLVLETLAYMVSDILI